MKTNPPTQRPVNSIKHYPVLSLSIAALCALAPISSSATSLYWDPNFSAAGVGGDGTWENGGASSWNTGSTGAGTAQAWNNTNLDTAYFGGTGGTVNVAGSVSTAGVYFASGAYTLNSTGTLVIKPSGSPTRIMDVSATSSVTVNANMQLDASARGGNTYYDFRNSSLDKLTINGNISVINAPDTSLRAIILNQMNSTGSIELNGSISSVGSAATAIHFGYDTAASSQASYYVKSDNSSLTNSNSADINRGTVYLSNGNGLGTGNIRLGNSGAAGNVAKLLTDGAITVQAKVSNTGLASVVRVVGGATAHNSAFAKDISLGNGFSLQMTAALDGLVDFLGVIGDGGGTSSIEKIGAGTVRFLNAAGSTYDGGTTISEGTLLVKNTSGLGTGTGTVTVKAGATLGGTGFIAPTGANGITVTGSIAPGDGIGTLTFNLTNTTGKVTMSTGAGFKFELGTANVGLDTTAAGSSDLLALAGAATGDFAFDANTVDFAGTGQVGYYKLFDTNLDSSTWTGLAFDSTTGEVSSGLTASNLANGFSGKFIVGTATNGGNVGDIYVQLQAVPEPATWSMMIGGLGVMTFIHRARRRMFSK